MTSLLLLFVLVFVGGVCADTRENKRRVHLSYPIRLLAPITGTHFSSNVTRDELVCFGNRDYSEPSYLQTLFCMFAMIPLPYVSEYLAQQGNANFSQPPLLSLSSCNGIWGSRSVIVDVVGSVEFLKVGKLPPESNFPQDFVAINATRWLELPTSSSQQIQREIRQVPAEPIYLCARSNDWTGGDAYFNIRFRPVYLRERDKLQCLKKTALHVAFLLAVSSVWLLPYLAALVVAAVSYAWGINKFIMALGFSCCLVCMAPLLLTKKNRHLTSLYFKYFFTRIQAEETRMVIQQRLPVFQALFFSSAVMCVGSAGSYIIYSYFGVDRETRNVMLKITMGISSSWFVFFVCRSFERFFRDWLWLAMSVALGQLLDSHLNPLSRDEIMVVTILISFCFKRAFPRVLLLARRNPRLNKLILRLLTLSSRQTLVHLWGQLRARTKGRSYTSAAAAAIEESDVPSRPLETEAISLADMSRMSDPLSEEADDEEADEEEDEDGDEDDEDGRDSLRAMAELASSISRRCSPAPDAGDATADLQLGTHHSRGEELARLLREGDWDDEELEQQESSAGAGLGLLASSWRTLSCLSHDSTDQAASASASASAGQRAKCPAPSCELISVGQRPVSVFALGPIAIDGRRVWLPLASPDATLLRLLHRGLAWLGPVHSREFAPRSDARKLVAHASFTSINAAASFCSWAQSRRNVEVLLSLANGASAGAGAGAGSGVGPGSGSGAGIEAEGLSEGRAGPGGEGESDGNAYGKGIAGDSRGSGNNTSTNASAGNGNVNSSGIGGDAGIALVAIHPHLAGRHVALVFKFAATGYPSKTTAARSLGMARRALLAIKEQFATNLLSSIRLEAAGAPLGPCVDHFPHIGIQCSVARSGTGAVAGTGTGAGGGAGTEAGAGSSSSAGDAAEAAAAAGHARLLLAHSVYQRLAARRREDGLAAAATHAGGGFGSGFGSGFGLGLGGGALAVPESARVAMAAVAALLAALGWDSSPVFDVPGFGVELLAAEAEGAGAGAADAQGRGEGLATSATGKEGQAPPSPSLSLVLSMPLLFHPVPAMALRRGPTGGDVGREAEQCLRMLLGSPGLGDADEHQTNKHLTSAVCVLCAAAHVGFLLRFSESDAFRAACLEDEGV